MSNRVLFILGLVNLLLAVTPPYGTNITVLNVVATVLCFFTCWLTRERRPAVR